MHTVVMHTPVPGVGTVVLEVADDAMETHLVIPMGTPTHILKTLSTRRTSTCIAQHTYLVVYL